MTNLRDLMIAYRAKERISQEELADRCGLSRVYINAVENGTKTPSIVTEARIRLVVDSKEE